MRKYSCLGLHSASCQHIINTHDDVCCLNMLCILILKHFVPLMALNLLLARLESAYSLIWGAREIWGKGGGETLALL